ncbi:LysR substrate-binding domain-containing protein [Aureimonas frigidaquae]|uniref:LysR substrate-binding domain-containing protein n=1 Tax=Aureimonas frigidaquae TaxID=424757 RepID=UPI0007843D07|nr:LysR substrate-binding domain-containing protein [Aureimonas frigidaquae]
MLTLQQLRYLVALSDTLSFSHAARLCRVTQPTLSMQVKELEQRLGTLLVERSRTRVLMTPTGARIAERARRVLAELADIQDIARDEGQDTARATLTFGVEPTVGAYVLSLAMPELRTAFPHMRFAVREAPADRLAGNLFDGSHDVLLLPEAPADGEVVTYSLLHEPLHVVVPADHRLASRDRIVPGDLRGETILTLEQGHGLNRPIAALARSVGAVIAGDYSGTTLDMLRLMVSAGLGITLLPALYVRSDVLREKLVLARPLASGAPVRDITMVWRSTAPRQETYAAVAASIASCLAPWGVARPAVAS